MLDRRQLLIGAGALPLFNSFAKAAAAAPNPDIVGEYSCWNAPASDPVVKPDVKVSLRKMLAELKAGHQPHLGMTRLDGYTVSTDGDILLSGRVQKGKVDLAAEDFLVALQSVSGKYGRPGCPLVSLDTIPGGFAKLNKLPTAASLGTYGQVCRTEVGGVTRVQGVPHNCQIAKTLLDADFGMKLVGWGAAKLKINHPFPAVFTESGQARIRHWREMSERERQAGNGRTHPELKTRPGSGKDIHYRRWFVPDKQTYVRDVDSVFLTCVQVVLRNEPLGADNMPSEFDEFERRFACSWTNRMQDVFDAEPLYNNLYSVFRHVALARVLRQSGDLRRLGDDSGDVIGKYAPRHVDIPDQMVHVEFRTIDANINGREWHFHQRYCGGVSTTGKVVGQV
jgi:hypothetical protein